MWNFFKKIFGKDEPEKTVIEAAQEPISSMAFNVSPPAPTTTPPLVVETPISIPESMPVSVVEDAPKVEKKTKTPRKKKIEAAPVVPETPWPFPEPVAEKKSSKKKTVLDEKPKKKTSVKKK